MECPVPGRSVSLTSLESLSAHLIFQRVAIADALIKLGISPVYHMREVRKNNYEDLWIQALQAKFENQGEPWTTAADFDSILNNFQVSCVETVLTKW